MTLRAAAVLLVLGLAACGQPDTATRDAVKAPIDKAEAVQDAIDAQAEATRAAVEQQADGTAAAPASTPATAAPP